MDIQSWVESHPLTFGLVVWPVLTGAVSWAFKPRTPDEYKSMPRWLAEGLRLLAAAGLDVPKIMSIVASLFQRRPPGPPWYSMPGLDDRTDDVASRREAPGDLDSNKMQTLGERHEGS